MSQYQNLPLGKLTFNEIIKDEEIATTLPLSGSVFNSVITQNFASAPERDGVKIPDRKPNQCLIFLGGNKNDENIKNSLLVQVCTHENGKKPEAHQLDWNGAGNGYGNEVPLYIVERWLAKGAKTGVWENPSKDKLVEHKELDVKFIELGTVVRIAKDGDNFKSVPPISMISMFHNMSEGMRLPGSLPDSKAPEKCCMH